MHGYLIQNTPVEQNIYFLFKKQMEMEYYFFLFKLYIYIYIFFPIGHRFQ